MRVTDLAPLAITFVVAGVSMGIGSEVLDGVRSGVTDQTALSTIGNVSDGIGELSSWMDTIGLVLAASVIIGVIFHSFGTVGR